MNPLELGQVVRSSAGRDRDQFLIVVGIVDEKHVLVSDGVIRKISNPKKKKVLHLKKTNRVAQEIKARLNEGKKVTNADIRKALQNLNIGDDTSSSPQDIPIGD